MILEEANHFLKDHGCEIPWDLGAKVILIFFNEIKK